MRHVVVLFVATSLCLVGAGAGALVFLAGDMPARDDVREIAGTDLYGNELKLSEHRGKVVLLVFSASDEGAGGDELTQKSLKRLLKRYDAAPFRVLRVNGDASRPAAKAFAERNRYDYHSIYDGPHGPIARQWAVLDYPTFYLIDHRGCIEERYDGFLIPEEVETDVAKMLVRINQK